jgi:hypothetical protein
MVIILIIILAVDVICSVIILIKSKRLYKKNNGVICKDFLILSSYFGGTMGILLWSYVLGYIISHFSGDFYNLMFIAFVGSAISLLPCIKGISKTLSIKI